METVDTVKTTRTTRMIYVEEISDTEKNSYRKSPNSDGSERGQTNAAFSGEKDREAVDAESGENKEEGSAADVPQDGGRSDSDVDTINDETTIQLPKELIEEKPELASFAQRIPKSPHPSKSPLPKKPKSPRSMATVVPLVTGKAAVLAGDGGNRPAPGRRDRLMSTAGMAIKGMKSHRAMQNMEEMRTIEDSLLYETLKPLVICMKASGIFFLRKKGSFGKSPRECLRSFTPLQIYCLVMIIVLFLNFVRTLLSFDGTEGFGSLLFFKFLTVIFAYESMSRALLAYMGCYKRTKGFQHIFLTLEKVCFSDGIIPYERPLKRTMHAFIIVTVVTAVINFAMTAWGVFAPDGSDMFAAYLAPVPIDLPGIIAFKIFVLVMVFINAIVAMLSLTFYTCICYGIYKEFEYFSRMFNMKIRDDGQFSDDLERFRIMHQKRCKLVEDADQSFKYYIANTYATNVPLLCLLLYSIVYTEDNTITYRFINTFRLLYVLLQMMVVSVAATLINNQAHAPLADMYSIRVAAATGERQLEMNMFLNKLTGTSIGLTAWDMFVINKPTVLTVIGMILTYFFLLVQFKNPLQGTTICECLMTFNGTANEPTIVP